MRHRSKTTQFKGGIDSSQMMRRKLMYNFLMHSVLVTTDKRAKSIKPLLEKVITLSKVKTEAHKNQLLSIFANVDIVEQLFKQVGTACASIPGGYLKVSHMGQRDIDAAVMMKLEWAHPVSLIWNVETPVKKNMKVKSSVKPEVVTEDK